MHRCDELAGCTEEPGRITRRFLTPPMRDAHQRLAEWAAHAGLTSRVDDAGNFVARLARPNAQRVMLVGSHLDTVPGGGRYDGVLGVLIGLAAAELVAEEALPYHVDVIGFSEEEGVRYNLPYIGSAAAAGVFQHEWLLRVDSAGVTLREAISAFALNGDGAEAAAYRPDEVIGYLEPHLEQGPVLERAGEPLGVVSAIAGQSRLRLEFVGEAGHAGTTPMPGRRDALVCASEFVQRVSDVGLETDDLRATVGRLNVSPGATNVIPERVELSLDVRHAEDAVREAAIERLLEAGHRIALRGGVRFAVVEQSGQGSVTVDPELTEMLAESVGEAAGHEPKRLVSGAGHDAVVMARRFPVAMLFVRHPGGLSHCPDERAERDDVAAAIDATTRFLKRLAERERSHTP